MVKYYLESSETVLQELKTTEQGPALSTLLVFGAGKAIHRGKGKP